MLSVSLKAQFNVNELGKNSIYFGIAMGFNVGDFKLIQTPVQPQNDSIRYMKTTIGPGFNLGIIGNYQFHKYFDLRFIPTLSFSDKGVEFEDLNHQKITKTISSIYLDFPLSLRFKSDPIKDFRIYAITGIRYDYDLASNVKARKADDIIKIGKNDVSAEIGIGFMIYFPYFILSPEFKVSRGVVNLLAPSPGLIYSRTIQRMYSRTFTFTLNLEG
ncbi:MAG: PorT protein [Bacteroidota bacterium]|nr:PorT protein [Bacteroidota bacterium]